MNIENTQVLRKKARNINKYLGRVVGKNNAVPKLIPDNSSKRTELESGQQDISNAIKKHASRRRQKAKKTPGTAHSNDSSSIPTMTNKLSKEIASGKSTPDPTKDKHKKLKRKSLSNSERSENINDTPQSKNKLVSETVESQQIIDTQALSVEPVLKKRKKHRKKKHPKKSENNSTTMQTNSNYPRELASSENLSCNWKKLFENINSSKTISTDDKQLISKAVKKTGSIVQQHLKSSTNTVPNAIWFDGVDKELLDLPVHPDQACTSRKENGLVRDGSFEGMTKAVAMDCEMVGMGQDGQDSVLARVSIVNLMGNCIFDKFVKTTEVVTDYRTAVSGIRPSDLEKGEAFKIVQEEVSKILDKRTLVGHAVHNDLKVLFLTHPRKKIRDTSTYKPFRQVSRGNTPSLKLLAQKLLGVKVQDGEHSSVQDAQAAMRLYTMHKKEWEHSLRIKQAKHKGTPSKAKVAGLGSPTGKKMTGKLSKLKI